MSDQATDLACAFKAVDKSLAKEATQIGSRLALKANTVCGYVSGNTESVYGHIRSTHVIVNAEVDNMSDQIVVTTVVDPFYVTMATSSGRSTQLLGFMSDDILCWMMLQRRGINSDTVNNPANLRGATAAKYRDKNQLDSKPRPNESKKRAYRA